MSAIGRVRRVRALLMAAVLVRSLAWGIIAAATLLATAALVDTFVPLAFEVRSVVVRIGLLAALTGSAALAWRDRAVLSRTRVALWIEEHQPELEYRLVTAVETGREPRLDDQVAARLLRTVRRRILRALTFPLVVALALGAATLLIPRGAVARVEAPHPGDALLRAALRDGSHLAPLVAQIVPPAYSGLRESSIDEPRDMRVLVGSVLVLRGTGNGRGIFARMGRDSIPASESDGEWSIGFRVEPHAVVARLVDRGFQRLVAIEPMPDAAPVVTLIRPAHDTVLPTAQGRIPLDASARDDFGLSTARFEYIISSGEGETFTFRSGTLDPVQPKGRTAALQGELSLDALALHPGDIVHVRAVARDGNIVSGPSLGASDTRTIRIARAGEYDSLSVDAEAPTDETQSLISERMLVTLAQALVQQRPALPRDSLVRESRRIAADQARLRRTVGSIVFGRLDESTGEENTGDIAPAAARTMEELLRRADSAAARTEDPIDFGGGESPLVAVNAPMLEAYEAMWTAGTALETGELGRALPSMRRALAAIERSRRAERVYLRGAAPPIVVDVDAVRLTGVERGASSTRRSVSADTAAASRVRRFARIVAQVRRRPAAAVDSLLVLRIDALADAPGFAAALHDAAAAMRAGHAETAAAALVRARRLLAGVPITRDSIARWGIVP